MSTCFPSNNPADVSHVAGTPRRLARIVPAGKQSTNPRRLTTATNGPVEETFCPLTARCVVGTAKAVRDVGQVTTPAKNKTQPNTAKAINHIK
jgi:hypothetical protein